MVREGSRAADPGLNSPAASVPRGEQAFVRSGPPLKCEPSRVEGAPAFTSDRSQPARARGHDGSGRGEALRGRRLPPWACALSHRQPCGPGVAPDDDRAAYWYCLAAWNWWAAAVPFFDGASTACGEKARGAHVRRRGTRGRGACLVQSFPARPTFGWP